MRIQQAYTIHAYILLFVIPCSLPLSLALHNEISRSRGFTLYRLFPNSVHDVFSWVTNFMRLFPSFINILIFFRLHFSCCRHDDTLSILQQNSFLYWFFFCASESENFVYFLYKRFISRREHISTNVQQQKELFHSKCTLLLTYLQCVQVFLLIFFPLSIS